ncbi:MAG: 50S ribosomal protein L10 [Nannocystaceae bacterium]|nr:50S ribosomal protein L10 [Nannocystaceae bacterium]
MDSVTKRELSAGLKDELDATTAMVLVEFSKLTVKSANELRGKFRDAGCTYKVLKNSTIRFAIAGTAHEPLTPLLKGVSGLAYNVEDPGAPARVARDFAKDNDELSIKGGIADGTVLDIEGVQRLAAMPGPRELKSQFLALLSTPATQMVRVLNAPAQNLLNVLNAKKDAAA